MRSEHNFNNGWLYTPKKVGDDVPDGDFAPVTLPHSNVILPYHNFNDVEYQFVSTYRKRFTLPEPLTGRRLHLIFAGAMLAATVTINGHTFHEHRGGYTPFTLDITDHINEDEANLLTVHLDSTERPDIPPFGGRVDYLTFGGIYRDVALRYVNPVYIENVRVRTYDVLTDNPRMSVDVTVKNQTDADFDDHLALLLGRENGVTLYLGVVEHVHVAAGETTLHTLELDGDDLLNRQGAWTNHDDDQEAYTELLELNLWSPETPYLYQLTVELGPAEDEAQIDAGTHPLDDVSLEFGFRQAQFKDDGFYLNGEKVFLRGLNRHQTYPYIGAAAPNRLQAYDADIIKYELGCNIVRTSHYPQSKAFLERCDEIGLLVFEEIPGWQHIGDDDWKALSLRDVRAMIERDWNHPSIIVWGVRINESFDDDDFYRQTNELARELDPTRPTTGVRFFLGSSFLEDVYGFNDFSNGVLEPQDTPHLITEFNGHMFPTKTFDGEERRVEHALRHARIQAQALATGGVAGAIGWCAFDYNTHREFGSGDRICYHGVMDIFRQPKNAAHFYASQMPPSQKIILQAATGWTMGDRSEGGNDPLTIFSNCERVVVYIGDVKHEDLTPDTKKYPYLPHPPFTATGLGMLWGQELDDLRIVGYIADEIVAEQRIAAEGLPARLDLWTAHDTLQADGADMTWVFFRVVDQHGNVLPYATTVITLEITEGTAELVGDNPFPLVGGQGALLLKATRTPSDVVVCASAPRLPEARVRVRVQD